MTTQTELLEKIEDILIAYGENFEEHHCEPSDVVAERIIALIPPAPAVGEALKRLLAAADEVGVKHLDTDTPDDEILELIEASSNARRALAALGEGGA